MSSRSDLESSILSTRESLRIVSKPVEPVDQRAFEIPAPAPVPPLDTSQLNGTLAAAPAQQPAPVRSHSKMNERPLTIDLPGMAKRSLLNRR